MTDYVPPLKDMLFTIHALSGLGRVLQLEQFEDFDQDVVDQVVEEAGKFASNVLAPINAIGDLSPARVDDQQVVTAPEFGAAYAQFVENGWQGLEMPTDFGGMGMPAVTAAAASETWQAACLSFTLCPMLTSGATTAIAAHGSDEIRSVYLPKMISGQWTGTMNLTEPQAGSDLSAVTTKAEVDGSHFRITGSKIFITWGDHEMSDNIVHLVLARLPDAPAGVRGISLFLVPKFLSNADGSPGQRNDVYATSVEHKLGVHASPTCVMTFGESGGATGYLVGEENKGLACMFTMMNHARIGVGIQGLAISERAYQLAKTYALERQQGRAPGVEGSARIVQHADVRRMLLVMRSQIEAMRAASYYTSNLQDIAHFSSDRNEKERAKNRVALLTPVIKAWLTEVAQELTSLGVQIHGGMGYVEETGAAQHMRDARILTIYEGTTGIQAADFVGRKILADDAQAIGALIDEMQSVAKQLAGHEQLTEIHTALSEAATLLRDATSSMLERAAHDANAAGAASANLLMLTGVVVGGWQMALAGLAIQQGAAADDVPFGEAKLLSIRFYAQHIMPKAYGYAKSAMAGADSVMSFPESAF